MADQKNSEDNRSRACELDDQQLDQVAGGTTRTGATDPVGAPKASFAEKLGGMTEGVAQVGLGVAAN
jgi:hypothetical protein